MSATGKAAQILDALLAHVGTLATGSPTLPVALPEIPFDPAESAADGKYLAVAIFPNRPAWEGVRTGVLDQGLLQISVVWPKDWGLIGPYEIAELIKTHFAKNTVLVSGATKVTITKEPWASQPMTDGDKTTVPVTIPWSA